MLLSAIVLALLVSPIAIGADGDIMRVGEGNSADDNETRIIGQNVSTYATRQSNNKEGDGGSATYGCRSTIGNESCLFVFALRTARAFDFRSRGNEGGRILVFGGSPDNNKPFTTNATGVATGLNADEVDGKSAAEIIAEVRAMTKVAVVAANGQLDTARSRGATSSVKLPAAVFGNGAYVVRFADPVATCGYSTTLNTIGAGGSVGVRPTGQQDTVRVSTRAENGNGADRPFHLVVTC